VHARLWPWKAWVQLPVITPSASWTAARPAGCNPAAFGQTWVGTRGAHNDELTADGRGLLIAPALRRGLQPEHLDAVEAFATRYAAA
jgi:hypothetical protein